MKVIRILLCDDQPLFREGLRTLLSLQPDFEIVGEAANGAEAIQFAKQHRPAVVLMDLQMPVLDGVAATRSLRADLPDCHVIALTTFDDDENVFEGLRAGAAGYLLKDASPEKLFEAIRVAARGESFLQPSVAKKVVAEFARLSARPRGLRKTELELLSDRELEVLRLVTTGASNKEIADKLFIAEGTVKNHVTSILGKLGVRDRTQAALKARDLDLV
jgi:DNA-binding NarL/FixJ family response regulator